ncbi:Maltose phosphorylase [Alkalibacterium sp. AK22]|uniref:glycoside hydrolase family 65 protein n=1 Tax=Alkalibacterium sp. AK22 TaxID=1229520 RepID=UPI000452F14C|nr:glycosyl hydrolase family 65 protein [Alkalibacterium sp. AK22]EXJ23473.1 Maltose phosphorylase [Alkalibacterium sp. AK22]
MHELIQNGTPWILRETGNDPAVIRQNETLFALSNGHFGTRGSLEEVHRTPEYSYSRSTLINGYYDTDPISYGEWAYGYATHHQTTIPVPDGKWMELRTADEVFDLKSANVSDHERVLDLKEGILTRSFQWETREGVKLDITIERFVSYDYPEILAQRMTLVPDTSGHEVRVTFELDDLEAMGKAAGEEQAEDLDPRKKEQTRRRFTSQRLSRSPILLLHIKTQESDLHALVGSVIQTDKSKAALSSYGNQTALSFWTKAGEPVRIDRFTAYSSFFTNDQAVINQSRQLEETLERVDSEGYDKLKSAHIYRMQSFWETSDIQIEGDPALQLGIRFNLFHLNQAAGRDGKRNMSAKGLTGEGYEGHYFWDTELYMLPFFLYTQPEIARALLSYRHSILPQARERARIMGIDKGALFAWRTINGEEASPYYPAGTAQIHINADIAHAVYSYGQITGDERFMVKEGLEILVETARFWVRWGHFDDQQKGAFVLNDVTGPDEYTAIVNNNFYTNYMAKKNLLYALELIKRAENRTDSSLKQLDVSEEEQRLWERAAELMCLPYDEKHRLTMQDDSFFHKAVWDFEGTPEDKYPLLLHYHPLTIYRHQVCKQADTVLAQFLFLDDFSEEQKARDFDYYEQVTTHDSSLSRSVFGMMASRIGKDEKAYEYFMDTALMDITDLQANTKDGVHAANMGGTWLSLVQGFAGMRLHDGKLTFSPRCPKAWSSLSFSLKFRGRLIRVKLTPDTAHYERLEGEPIAIQTDDEQIVV